MELKLNLNFNQILSLVRQLNDKEKERLAESLQSDIASTKPSKKKDIQEIILNAPTWGEEELTDWQNARTHGNNSRII